jgi:hypothetical protein
MAEAPFLLAYLPLALLFTWPLGAHLSDRLLGDRGDAWQNLWNIEWLRRALLAGHSPFQTSALWHPDGTTLLFQTFDLPDALLAVLLAVLLRGVASPWLAHNLVVLWTFAASGAAMYLLGRGNGASRPAAFLSGCAYTFTTFHFGHARGHLHIMSMEYLPLFVLGLQRVLSNGTRRWALFGGVMLALASLASWYHLFTATIVSAGLVAAHLLRPGGAPRWRWLTNGLLLCASYLVLVGPLGFAMVRALRHEPMDGSHDASVFSADLQSFFVPNAASAVGRYFAANQAWSGNGAENASYLGYLLLAFAVAGLVLRAPRVGGYLAAALLGVLLSLGPALKWGGAVVWSGPMPYALLVKAVPTLSFAGVPVRLAAAATFGLAAALAPTIDLLARRWRWRVVAPLAALAVAEHWPHALFLSSFPLPAPMHAWANDAAPFAVLDATRDMRSLWHQTQHGHPIVGGYLTRTPERLVKALAADPVAGPLLAWDAPTHRTGWSITNLAPSLQRPLLPDAERTHFSFDVAGELQVVEAGEHLFEVASDDAAVLTIDGRPLIDNGGAHPVTERTARVFLPAGRHRIALNYRQFGGQAFVRVSWGKEGDALRVVSEADVPGGLHGVLEYRRRETPLEREQALEQLARRGVRHIVVDLRETRFLLEQQLGLKPAYEGAGVRIYDLPAR